MLATEATLSAESRGRAHPEEPDEYRTAFDRASLKRFRRYAAFLEEHR